MAIATVAALFDISGDGGLQPTKVQREIALSDEFQKTEETASQLLRTSDFAPYRPATDVTALAIARAPGEQAQSSWLSGIMVGEKQHVLRVHGPRYWQHSRLSGWKITQAQPALEVPLNYTAAFGGPILVKSDHVENGNVDIWNPIGPGILHKDTPKQNAILAPSIEHADHPIDDPFTSYQPQGIAPIAPVWRFREQFVGTYDQTWLKTQHPFLPPDFDPRFYNVAHPALQFEPFLRGDELVRAANMFPSRPDLAFYLPNLAFGAVATRDSGQTVKSPMALDGVHLELLGREPQVRITWRISLPWRDGIKTIDIGHLNFESTQQNQVESVT